jgi:hypothetical protein
MPGGSGGAGIDPGGAIPGGSGGAIPGGVIRMPGGGGGGGGAPDMAFCLSACFSMPNRTVYAPMTDSLCVSLCLSFSLTVGIVPLL